MVKKAKPRKGVVATSRRDVIKRTPRSKGDKTVSWRAKQMA
jgi:hypothetical protein